LIAGFYRAAESGRGGAEEQRKVKAAGNAVSIMSTSIVHVVYIMSMV
jgi:hypothetical protein